ncbi:transposase domain-containing protein [uncultured Tateyamaria sp.]
MNGINPQTWRADTLSRIPDYTINHVDDLLP